LWRHLETGAHHQRQKRRCGVWGEEGRQVHGFPSAALNCVLSGFKEQRELQKLVFLTV
jgi:hypothetical protein